MGQRGKTSPVMITALSLALLAGCGGDGTNPFQEDPEEPTEETTAWIRSATPTARTDRNQSAI